MTKLIAIDARPLSIKGGTYTYISNLLKNFDMRNDVLLVGVKNFLDYDCVPITTNQQNPFFRLLWENILLPRFLSKRSIRVYHGTKGVVPMFTKTKTIVTVHDLNSLKYPEFYNFSQRIYWSKIVPLYIKRADKIIAVSEATKSDIIHLLAIPSEKVVVIHEGYAEDTFYIKDKFECLERVAAYIKSKINKDISSKRIILNVNTISPRKNIVNLIKAFNNVAADHTDTILIICGKKGWKYEEIFNQYEKSAFKDRIYFLEYVTDGLIADLYNIATVFVYPSFYEGFGLPILEAQACGCPVITSNLSSMPEITGDSAILISPFDYNAIAVAINNLIEDESVRRVLIEKGSRNTKCYNWRQCSSQTQQFYQSMIN